MKNVFLCLGLALLVLFSGGYESEVQSISGGVSGVELTNIKGWLANIYPWAYNPSASAVHPVEGLWSPNNRQTPFQIIQQDRQLDLYGSGADILEFNVSPGNPDYNHWLSVYFTNSRRPFFVLYEHIFGNSNYVEHNGPKNMDLGQNRQAFMRDIDFIFKNIILPNQSRYVTVNGRAVIYMWSTVQMSGDFASLLLEAKDKYPVFFIGSEGMGGIPDTENDINRVKALDGFMDYSLGGPASYMKAVQDYYRGSFSWRQFLRGVETETGKKHLLIPTFQAAYDDTNLPDRSNPPMYPRNLREMEYHAELIRSGMGTIYSNIGPFVVYSELPEGAAVIESQCTSKTQNQPNRYTGCGTGRLEVLKRYFGRQQ